MGEAVAVLRARADHAHRAAYDNAVWWMRSAVRLAELYSALGRASEADALAAILEPKLAEAEPGFPLVQRLHAITAR